MILPVTRISSAMMEKAMPNGQRNVPFCGWKRKAENRQDNERARKKKDLFVRREQGGEGEKSNPYVR